MSSVVTVSSSAEHGFSKQNRASIAVVAGLGVVGDAHSGELVKHRYLVRQDATQPNLRQVHLIQAELFASLRERGNGVAPGQLGENVTTRGVDLLGLPTGAVVRIGSDAVLELTGLRNPCRQIDEFQEGLMRLLRFRDEEGNVVRIAGVMSVVLAAPTIRPGDTISVELPPEPHQPLAYIADSHKPRRTPGIG
jgi:MOSC domain-containing protein YiiM